MHLSNEERVRRFEALVHATPEFVAIADIEGTVQFVNEAGRRLVGLSAEVDVTTTTIADYLTEEGLAASIATEQPAILRDGAWRGETTLRDWRGGPAIPVEVSSFLVADVHTGEPLALATIQRDLREVRAAAADVAAAQLALRESELRQRALLLHMSDVLIVVDPAGILTYASPSASRLLGYPEGSWIGRDVLDLIHEDDRAASTEALRQIAASSGTGPPMRLRLLGADGSEHHYEAMASNLLDEPTVGGIVIVARDVAEQHRAEVAQTMQARVLELIANGDPVAEVLAAIARWVDHQLTDTACSILLVEEHAEGRVLRHGASPGLVEAYREAVDHMPVQPDASPCAATVTGARATLVPDLLADDRWVGFQDLARRCNVRSCWSYPILSPATGQTLGTFALFGTDPGMPDPGLDELVARASHLVGITVDQHTLLARLAHQATHDGLTGLPNRTMLLERLNAALDRRPLHGSHGPVVMFLDLDRLKIVNDSLGHERGDELLVQVAERLPGAVPDDVLVARFGGDEFVILAEEVADRDAAARLVEGVLKAVARPLRLEGRLITPSASAGVVLATAGQTANEVLRDADIAMYRAKHLGGGTFQFSDSDMRQRAFDRLELEGQLRHALSAQQFRIYYQPIVDLQADGAVVGFEALVRWEHPTRGLLTPASFVELAEETGLILPLGAWVLETAAATARSWADLVPDAQLTLSVNLSARQLADPGLIAAVEKALACMAPWSLSLELTESTLMDEASGAKPVLDELAATGARLSIDDFGTGFSSLSYLTRLPVSSLKIDRSFVLDLENRPEAATVAAAVVSLGKGLQLMVVAEGIETEDQWRQLADLGCRYGQGYLFGRPMPADDALALLKA